MASIVKQGFPEPPTPYIAPATSGFPHFRLNTAVGNISAAPILQSVKSYIKEIRRELKDTGVSKASGIQGDLMEELELFQAWYGLEEKT